MIIVTGGAGFIGSNIVRALNHSGVSEILVVDNLFRGEKFFNLADCQIADYLDKDDFFQRISAGERFQDKVDAVIHQGACAVTTEWDGRYMLRNNYELSKALLHWSLDTQTPFIYASSAAVYGKSSAFSEDPSCEAPLNVYGFSKLMFDQYVRRILRGDHSQIVGLRYFNVYGPREQHKQAMASAIYHFNKQILDTGRVLLFEGSDAFSDGEQRRDFVYVDDVVTANLWFLQRPEVSGIFNMGSGRSASFNEVARAVIRWHGKGEIGYIPFPEGLKAAYQSNTQANLSSVRALGFEINMRDIDQGVNSYLDVLNIGVKAASDGAR